MEKYKIKFDLLERIKKYKSYLLTKNSPCKSDTDIKVYLLKNNLLNNKCNICNNSPMWNNKPLDLILDRKNNLASDNTLDNLQLVCPNCLSQIKKKSSIFTKITEKTIHCRDCGKKIKFKTQMSHNVKYNTHRCKSCLDKAVCQTDSIIETNIKVI